MSKFAQLANLIGYYDNLYNTRRLAGTGIIKFLEQTVINTRSLHDCELFVLNIRVLEVKIACFPK